LCAIDIKSIIDLAFGTPCFWDYIPKKFDLILRIGVNIAVRLKRFTREGYNP
jgi:hypothetical protein